VPRVPPSASGFPYIMLSGKPVQRGLATPQPAFATLRFETAYFPQPKGVISVESTTNKLS
jgi:hypothetical protein